MARSFLEDLRDARIDNEEYRRMLIRSFVDRIYLYDDHFDIFLNNSGKKGKVSDYEAADIERYFDNNPGSSSFTLESGTPIENGS